MATPIDCDWWHYGSVYDYLYQKFVSLCVFIKYCRPGLSCINRFAGTLYIFVAYLFVLVSDISARHMVYYSIVSSFAVY